MKHYSGNDRAGVRQRCPDCYRLYSTPAYMHHTLAECLANIAAGVGRV